MTQRISRRSEGGERLARLHMQCPHALARGADTGHHRVGCSLLAHVRAGRLAERDRITGGIEHIVFDLKSQPDGLRIALERGPVLCQPQLPAGRARPSARWRG